VSDIKVVHMTISPMKTFEMQKWFSMKKSFISVSHQCTLGFSFLLIVTWPARSRLTY